MLSEVDPSNPRYASRLVRDRLAWASLTSVIKSLLQGMERLAGELEAVSSSELYDSPTPFLEIERLDLTKMLEVLDIDVATRTDFLLGLHTNAANLEQARAAVEQGECLKRISWLQFIFLPLMFIASIFGMNVDWFKDYPTARWYFVAAFAQLLVLLGAYVAAKAWTKGRRKEKFRQAGFGLEVC